MGGGAPRLGMNLAEILRLGAQSLPIIISTISTSLILAFILYRAMKMPSRISTLIGVGSSICGGSAIAATAPRYRRERRGDRPVHLCHLPVQCHRRAHFPNARRRAWPLERRFGLFAGTAINDTSSVTAAAAAWDGIHGSNTLDQATIVKLHAHPRDHSNHPWYWPSCVRAEKKSWTRRPVPHSALKNISLVRPVLCPCLGRHNDIQSSGVRHRPAQGTQ